MYADSGGIFSLLCLQLNIDFKKDNMNPEIRVYIVLFVLCRIRGPPWKISKKIRKRRCFQGGNKKNYKICSNLLYF